MGTGKSKHGLVEGLRALELLARLAPVGLEAYAKAGRFSIDEANALIETFESDGYVKRLPQGDLYMLKPFASALVCKQLANSAMPSMSVH